MQLVDNAAAATATFRIAYDETDQRVLSVEAVQQKEVTPRDCTVTAMAAGHDFHRTALVESETGLPPSASSPSVDETRVEIISFHPEHVVMEADSPAPALLVLAEAWYPGWTATVDGDPARCVPANAWMRAVEVPPGAHRVELRFRSRWLGPGALLALLTAGGLALLVRRARHGPRG